MANTALVYEKCFDSANLSQLFIDGLTDYPFSGKVTVMADSVDSMVRKITSHALTRKLLFDEVIISGHGSPGNQSVGDGEGYDKTGRQNLSIWTYQFDRAPPGKENTLVGDADTTLAGMAPALSTAAVITLTGCNVAMGMGGRQLLSIMSKALGGRKVQAATGLQTAWVPGMEGEVIACKGDYCWSVTTSSWWGTPG
jgi:hypothetical protein